MRYNILIGGKAGQGINEIAHLISTVLALKGFHVFNAREYQSVIRGGHNFNIICISDEEVMSYDEKIDILMAMDSNTYEIHKLNLSKQPIIVTTDKPLHDKLKCIFLDTTRFEEVKNIAFLGFIAKVMSIERSLVLDEIKRRFGNKKFYDADKKAVEYFYSMDYEVSVPVHPSKNNSQLLCGSEAVVNGALDSGLGIYFSYPMTPTTGILTLLAQKKTIPVIQLESEIACINAALGASFAGKVAMTGTSGGGFDLMTEGLSMAGMMELPIVIQLGQRPGPSTGLPTYTSQGDLNVALYGGHGEFPRIVVAPGDIAESYEKTEEAFLLSEKFSMPAIVLTDKHLLESYSTMPVKEKPVRLPIRLNIPGKKIVRKNSYEHDNEGNTTEDALVISQSFESRKNKALLLSSETKKLVMHKLFGKGNSLIISFGSTKGAILDAIKSIEGFSFLQIIYLEPFPDISGHIKKAERVFVVENNATAQLADLIARHTGIIIKNRILRYDGRPFTPANIINELKNARYKS